MQDLISNTSVGRQKRNLTVKFVVTAIFTITIIVGVLTVLTYWHTSRLAMQISIDQVEKVVMQDTDIEADVTVVLNDPQKLDQFARRILAYPTVSKLALYDSNKILRWSSKAGNLSAAESKAFDLMISNSEGRSVVIDYLPVSFAELTSLIRNRPTVLPALIPIQRNGRTALIVKVVRDYSMVLNGVQTATVRFFLVVLLACMTLFLVFYYNFWRGIQTIEKQEQELNQQISRLSNLLSLNKSMQRSMKTASRRAVELNEQFLRRVGSDLHDGPAQSLGYSILRLNQVSQREASSALSHEFHAVKEALDEALEEIRGISSGLVLPELEEMTLVESLHKVVTRHEAHSDTVVTQYYQDLPEDIPLPIKICAYRFVQEGLNNAQRHGQAEKCRVTAYVKDDVLHLSLKDNGMGFRKSQLSTEGGHLGLMGLKDRIESLGGQ